MLIADVTVQSADINTILNMVQTLLLGWLARLRPSPTAAVSRRIW